MDETQNQQEQPQENEPAVLNEASALPTVEKAGEPITREERLVLIRQLRAQGADRFQIMATVKISQAQYYKDLHKLSEEDCERYAKEQKAHIGELINGLRIQILRLETAQQKREKAGQLPDARYEQNLIHLRCALRDTLQSFKYLPKAAEEINVGPQHIKVTVVCADDKKEEKSDANSSN